MRGVKRGSNTQHRDQAILPEASLGLQKVGRRARALMLYTAYLEPDFIPKLLFSSLVGDPDEAGLHALVAELQALSLVQLVYRDG